MGPAALRTAGLPALLSEMGYDVVDHGDLPHPAPVDHGLAGADAGACRNAGHIAAWTRIIHDRAYEMAQGGGVPVFMGGDHSLSMGTVSAMARHCRDTGPRVVRAVVGRPCRFQHAGHDAVGQHAWHVDGVRLRRAFAEAAAGRPAVRAGAAGECQHLRPALDRQGRARDGEGPGHPCRRYADDRSGERVDPAAADYREDRRGRAPTCMSAWMWTSSIPASLRRWGRRCRVGRRTARRI